MRNIFKYLWESKGIVMGIILLLIVQAFCDLSLPQYTSDIVDIGIQQEGIAHLAMEEMRAETFEAICLFLQPEQEQQLRDSYQQKEGESYHLKKLEQDSLNGISTPSGLCYCRFNNCKTPLGV